MKYEKHGIKFSDEDHYKRFMHLMYRKDLSKIDSEYCSAFYILSSNERIFHAIKEHVDKNGIDVQKLKRMRYLSTTELYLVKIACAIFNSIETLKLDFYWVIRLDSDQYEMLQEAFRIRRLR